jgi:glycosyltransferase involved in cell wall biosynthesis
VHLDVLGHADETPDYYEQCLRMVEELELHDYVTFHGSVNVRKFLGRVDLLVLPSYNEGQPIVVLEAMTAGIPVIGTAVGGMCQLVEEPLTTRLGETWGPAGSLVQSASANPDLYKVLADKLEHYMTDTQTYKAAARNARGRVIDFFRLEDVARAYNNLYQELSDPSQGGPAQFPRQRAGLAEAVPDMWV